MTGTTGCPLLDEMRDAIDILDGNMEPIDWRDGKQPELLRKLCEHLEVYRKMQARSAAARRGWQTRRG